MSAKLLLIDGDLLLHRGCVAVETEVQWDDDNHMLFSSFPEAWHNVVAGIKQLFDRFDTDDHIIALSSRNNFRKEIDPTYKGNRKGMRKPMCYARAREELVATYVTREQDGLEADDIMGIWGSRLKGSIICSMDKDMKTVPATIWNGKEVIKVTEDEANYNHLYQTLTGDTADGYPGCPGVGPVKAKAILPMHDKDNMPYTLGEWWARVKAVFEKAGKTEEDALRQARLARILRDSDWDPKSKKPILWSPPT